MNSVGYTQGHTFNNGECSVNRDSIFIKNYKKYSLFLEGTSEKGRLMVSVVSSYNKGMELLKKESVFKRMVSIVLFIGLLISTVFVCVFKLIGMVTRPLILIRPKNTFKKYAAMQLAELNFAFKSVKKTAVLFGNIVCYVAQGKKEN